MKNRTQEVGATFFWAESTAQVCHCIVLKADNEKIVVLRSAFVDGAYMASLLLAPKLFIFEISIGNLYYLNKVFQIDSEIVESVLEAIEKK